MGLALVVVLPNTAVQTTVESISPNTCLSLSTSRDLKSFPHIDFAPGKPQSVLRREHSMERNPKPVTSGKNPHHGCHRCLGVVCCPSIDPCTDGSVAVVSAATRG